MSLKKSINWLHRWLGLALSLWLFLISLTGTLLLFKNDLLQLTYPELKPAVISNSYELPGDLSHAQYTLLPNQVRHWVEVVDTDQTRHYYSASGEKVLVRAALSDWIDVMVEFHHHLLLNQLGKQLQGIFGIGALSLLLSGLYKWWPKRRLRNKDFQITWAKPGNKNFGQTLWQSHRTFGVILFIPMLIVTATGTAMIYSSEVKSALIFLFPYTNEEQSSNQNTNPALNDSNYSSWSARLAQVNQVFDSAQPSVIYHQANKIRLKQLAEWHPNGRSYIEYNSDGNTIKQMTNYHKLTLGEQISHTVYPLHIASVGGTVYLTLIMISGVVLLWLSISGAWFWWWKRQLKKR